MTFIFESAANRAALKNLTAAMKEKPLALVGAGLSVAAGLPSWNALLTEMEHQLEDLDLQYRYALRDADALWRAEEYRYYLGEKAYQKLIKDRFGAPVTMKPDSVAVQLVKLPFRHFMTTNYDDVLTTAHKVAGLRVPEVMNWSNDEEVGTFMLGLRDSKASPAVLHLHGHHSSVKSIVLTENDYIARYIRSAGTAPKLFAILATERVVFVGFSLSDPDLMALLRSVNATLSVEQPRHFAIVGLEKSINEALVRGQMRKRYGVDPVFYDNWDGQHAGLIEILQSIRGGKPAAEKPKVRTRKKESKAVFDPEDPQKGQWGGSPTANGRKVSATVEEIEMGWYESTITVESTNKKKPLTGMVTFHIHPTFFPPTRRITARNGKATLVLESYGSFTVGVEADGGETKLEIDLAEIPGAPLMFQMN